MTDIRSHRVRFGLVVGVWLISVVAAVGQGVLLIVTGSESLLVGQLEPTDIAGALGSIGFATIGALVILRGESRTYGWLLLGFGALSGVLTAAGYYALAAFEFGYPAQPLSQWIQDLFLFAIILGLLMVPALFPDGRFASPSWRRATVVTATLYSIYATYFVFAERGAENLMLGIPAAERPMNPTGVLPASEWSIGPPWVLLTFAILIVALGSLTTRWRRSGTETRLQIKWVIAAFGVLFATYAVDLAHETLIVAGMDLGIGGILNVLSAVAQVGIVVAFGIAVLRYRLYDVDLVINRTIVYGVLTMVVIAMYGVIVLGVGSVVSVDEPALAIVVAGLAALLFAPLRDRVQGSVNRLMFGRRSDPYTLLSDLGAVMTEAGTPDETLQAVADTVVEALKVPAAAIDLEREGTFVRHAVSGQPNVGPPEATVVPLRHLGDEVGRLAVWPRSVYEPLSPRDRALLDDIAGPAGAIARSARLTVGLQSSRERLVLAREEERRRIRRDLHDGLGPSLAFQTLQLDAILDRIHDDPDEAVALVIGMKRQTQQLVGDIRRLVHELRPPALDELGVAAALAAHASQLNEADGPVVRVESRPDPLPPLSAAVEVAAYHITREAITNVVRHAAASRCTATLAADPGSLDITIRDDGLGIPAEIGMGVGMQSMRERTEELGGTFTMRNLRPHGTEISITIPAGSASTRFLDATEAGAHG